MRDKGQSLPGKRFTSLPLTMASIHAFSTVLRCCVVKHLRRRFKPPKEEMKNKSAEAPRRLEKATELWTSSSPSVSDTYRLQDCHRHLKFCPAFLLCSGAAAGVCCAGRWGLWLPAGEGWEAGGGDGVIVGCGRVRRVKWIPIQKSSDDPHSIWRNSQVTFLKYGSCESTLLFIKTKRFKKGTIHPEI